MPLDAEFMGVALLMSAVSAHPTLISIRLTLDGAYFKVCWYRIL